MKTATIQKSEERKKIKRIRGPELAILIKKANGVPFVEGLARADQENRVIASSKRLGKALVGSGEWRSISEVFGCWSGTNTGYVEPNTVFKNGKLVRPNTFEEIPQYNYVLIHPYPKTGEIYVFPIPKDFEKERNGILVAEHPNYRIASRAIGKIMHHIAIPNDLKSIDLISGFPTSDGWYPTDAKHGIPSEAGSSDKGYLLRLINSRVGPVERRCNGLGDWYDDTGHYVVLNGRPSVGRGMAVEARREARVCNSASCDYMSGGDIY